ncbi:uncharacterized protein LOC129583600 isoform X2 [Paramacrobiotus metropolitanus]|uniref:uncharacterized protein LOC129583600 isoform X2 n=1 Tax=Paramacrobiotus metropolitanus TaxID=2943436 RepID=UPI00244630D8|nr:uncharacterized protein LOC129583600 isoform X2 [Paramacrobiotus metropolitanus]
MAEICRECVAKDNTIINLQQTIENLKTYIHRLTNGEGVTQGQQIITAAAAAGLVQNADGNLEFPTVSLEELSAFADVHPVQFVQTPVVTTIEPAEHVQGLLSKRILHVKASGSLLTDASGAGNHATEEEDHEHEHYEENEADGEEMSQEQQLDEEVISPVENQAKNVRQDGQRQRGQHVLVLGSPHTRKIPLRCPLPDCPHADYRAWDRDLLRKHFEKYHKATHPSPIFNYLCPFDGCKYISYNEPSYALYTHIKNVHREYLAQLEQNLARGLPNTERDLNGVDIDVLPSEIKRTPVPILGTISMEKLGLRCPLPVCQAGTVLFKYSSMKKLVEHFEKLHSFTHPNPYFIYCCPVEGCNYSSEVGNFRVYKHMKADHSEMFLAVPLVPMEDAGKLQTTSAEVDGMAVPTVTEPGMIFSDGEIGDDIANNEAQLVHHTGEQPSETTEPVEDVLMPSEESVVADATEQTKTDEMDSEAPLEFGTKIFMKGSANMIVDPLRCPVEDCPKQDFIATSTVLMKRHFWKQHRYTHPNPEFHFLCPVEGCTFITNATLQQPKQQASTNIWRHIKRSHPEYALADMAAGQLAPINATDEASAVSGNAVGGEAEAETLTSGDPVKSEEQLRVSGVEDVLHPGTLVKPFQLQCLFPGCTKPPFSGADKTQLLRHYAHYHTSVDRRQPIVVTCPMKDCTYECIWPPKPLYYHVESVHAEPDDSGLLHPANVSLTKESAAGDQCHTPVQIVGRPYKSGSFWCPVPGCGFSNTVLLHMRNHVLEAHQKTHPNPTFIFVCPIQGCSFAKQNNYQALCTHMQREHGMKKERTAISPTKNTGKRKAETDGEPPAKKTKTTKKKAKDPTRAKAKRGKKSVTKEAANNAGHSRANIPVSTQEPVSPEKTTAEKIEEAGPNAEDGSMSTDMVDKDGNTAGETLWIIKKRNNSNASTSTLRRGAPRKAKSS